MVDDEILERAWSILDRLSARGPDPLLREVAGEAADRLLIVIDGIADVGQR